MPPKPFRQGVDGCANVSRLKRNNLQGIKPQNGVPWHPERELYKQNIACASFEVYCGPIAVPIVTNVIVRVKATELDISMILRPYLSKMKTVGNVPTQNAVDGATKETPRLSVEANIAL